MIATHLFKQISSLIRVFDQIILIIHLRHISLILNTHLTHGIILFVKYNQPHSFARLALNYYR